MSYPVCNSPQRLTQLDNGGWGCLTDQQWEEQEIARVDTAGVNISPKPADSWTNILIYGGVALVLLAVLKK